MGVGWQCQLGDEPQLDERVDFPCELHIRGKHTSKFYSAIYYE